jgi:hypothetical protein
METQFFELRGGQWIKSKLNAAKLSWRWIKLYDDNLNEIGIGMYQKNNHRQ